MLQKKLLTTLSVVFFAFGLLVLLASFFQTETISSLPSDEQIRVTLNDRWRVAEAMKFNFKSWSKPETIQIRQISASPLKVEYTIETELQRYAEDLLQQFKPDYSAIFLMDALTGRVLVMTSFEKGAEQNPDRDDWVRKATFPAASVFKVITATAAVDKAGVDPQHKIYFNGGNYTLYRKNVLSEAVTKWTRIVTLKEAFAKSLNTAFGRLSLENLNPSDLRDYAERFMFNREIPTDFPVEVGAALIPSEKGFAMTEIASGYNRTTKLSPVQGAMIAATIVNDGNMITPYIVKSLKDEDDEVVYKAAQLNSGQIIATESAYQVRELMEETILAGTSRKTFQKLVRDRKFREVQMGGKTGHLNGDFPKGRTDWFVGYAFDDHSRVAVGIVTVNKKSWTVKSSYLGQSLFRKYFEKKLAALHQ